MKFIKFFGKIGYAVTTSFGFAALITGFISVIKLLINFRSINSFSEALNINSSIFDFYIWPLSISIFFVLLIIYSLFALLGKRNLLDNHIPF
ncbi:MAG: hypothetical protein DSY77_16190 [Bacteroidetes bacterium]|nr:MAG: hypothetical protein DSY77_16190 [Bacteroidota bacterium]